MDALERGLEFEDEEHPILYLSRKLLLQEQRYAIIEKVGLAIKWAVDILVTTS